MMLYLGRESTPGGIRQQSNFIKPVDIITSYPPPPSKRAFNKDYYYRRNSSIEQRISDKPETHNSYSVLQDISEGTTPSSAHAIESIATGKFCKDFKTAILNNLYWQSVVFGGTNPYYRLSGILDRNFGSICGHFDSEYSKQSETVKNNLPKLSRMTNEHRKTNSEQSTENREVSSFSMVHGVNTTATKGFKTRSIQTTGDDTGHENGTLKSAFVPVACRTSHNGLLDNLKVGEKRKLQSLTSEKFVSGLWDGKGKRFKSDETESIYKRNGLFNEFKQPFYFGDKSINCNPSFKQNPSSLNGITKDVSRQLDFNFNTTSNDMSKHLFRFKPEEMRINPEVLKNNLTRVGEAESMRHGAHGDASVSKNGQETTSVEANDSREFISLDSTRSSFLTQIQELRQNVERKAIPCPFCSQTFSKYPDLKIHVQTHKYANISGIKRDQRNQQPESLNGNGMSTPVSSPAIHNPHPPSRRLSTGDDGVMRATSVIQFAEKKNKERTRK
jgi:hypothetical protein